MPVSLAAPSSPVLARPGDLATLWGTRSKYFAADHQEMDDVVGTYFGQLPSKFDDFFHAEMHRHIVNLVRLSWDDLANLAGKVFPIYVTPDNDKPTAKTRAELQEQVAYGWNEAGRRSGGISMESLMRVLMWWLVGTANAVAMVLPDTERKSPYFTFRDPRTYYPPVGSSPYTQAEPADALFAYRMTAAEIKQRYPDKAGELDNSLALRRAAAKGGGRHRNSQGRFAPRPSDDDTHLWVGEYYIADAWYVATLEDRSVILTGSESGDPGHPGVNPVVAMSLYSPNSSKGRSLFSDQVSLQAAMSRMFSQKLDWFDRTLYPVILHTPLAGKTIRIGPYATNEYDVFASPVPPRMDTITPAHNIDASEMMTFTHGMSKMLNRNPDSFQGQGEADSSKALSRLEEGVNRTIRETIWPPALETIPRLYTKAGEMTLNLWPGSDLSVTGRSSNSWTSGERFKKTYVPRRDLKGRTEDWEVEPGMGLGGFQEIQEMLMLFGAEAISEDYMIERLPGVRDSQAMKRQIQSDRLRKLQLAKLAADAEAQKLAPDALALLDDMVQGGMDMYEAIKQLVRQGKLELPPAPPMGPGMPGMPGMPPGPGGPPGAGGIPPELAGLMPEMGAIGR